MGGERARMGLKTPSLPGDAACLFSWIEDLAAAGIAEFDVSKDGFCFCFTEWIYEYRTNQ
jgi:hypothetical protein